MEEQLKISADVNNFGDVIVVGGGISGIQAALDLATSGFKVFLVEKAPTIGGKMAQLDKTFPTNDCSMCIESPKFIECDRHPNIEILTYTEVEKVEGKAGDFTVYINKKPRYIIEDKCTGCTVCSEYCPIRIPDPFNQQLSTNKATHIYFSQAVPLVPYIDEACSFLKDGKCKICEGVCKNKAIDLYQKPEKKTLKVGAIVLSPGYDVFHPELRNDYGYGILKNVVTSLDFERLLCATGPHTGEILRPSDHKHPKRIAWIHCVGSRQTIEGGNSYCSSVCCTYIQKQVILAKDHDSDLKATIFHNDIRSYGKEFERFYQRTESLPDVKFIRSYVTIGRENQQTNNITIKYSTTNDGVKEEEFDLVVLGVGLTPPRNVDKISEIFGVELNAHNFCNINPTNPIKTSRPGIFISGAFQGPLDIPESVIGASGANALVGELLKLKRGKLSKERIYPEERDVSNEEIRVGVFACHCGANIGRIIDIPGLVNYSLNLENVVHAEEGLFICSTDAAQQISNTIKEKKLNRVIVAACTPKTHEPLFRDTLREGGINQYFFDFANIREHCSWVHSKQKEEASQKAKDLVRMSVARVKHLEPLQEFDLPVNKTALVVGGGIAGMTCALSIANQGYQVHLIEKESELGGMALKIPTTIEGLDVKSFINKLIQDVYKHPLVSVSHSATITDVSGYVGNFVTTVHSEGSIKTIQHGAAVLATGAVEYKPVEYNYGKSKNILTSVELGEQIELANENILKAKSLVMIQCVGCRQEDRNYCSRVCCSHSIKNALKLKKINSELDIYILFRDIRTYGYNENYYRLASENNVKFIRYEPQNKPKIEIINNNGNEIISVIVNDPIMNKDLQIDADILSLAAAVVSSEGTYEASRMFKVALNQDGFFQEAHVKLRPVDFAAEGIFLCGSAHYPKHISETISQAYGAAGRTVALLSQDTVRASGSVCDVNQNSCVSCGACISVCTYGAINFNNLNKATVNSVLCKGDGLCNVVCPTSAISLKHYTDTELLSQIEAAISK